MDCKNLRGKYALGGAPLRVRSLRFMVSYVVGCLFNDAEFIALWLEMYSHSGRTMQTLRLIIQLIERQKAAKYQ